MENNLKNIAVVTYTNTKCHDILRIHANQIEEYAGNIKSYILTDQEPKTLINAGAHEVILYDDNKPYYKQWVESLNSIEEEYIIYLQEDFLLFDDVKYDEIKKCVNFLSNSEYSFVRFSKFELQMAVHGGRRGFNRKDFLDIKLEENIYDAYCQDPDCYSFMMQATIWKKNDFVRLYNAAESKMWYEDIFWNEATRSAKIQGAFYYSGGLKLGKFHYESHIWPHVCTAVGSGKWSITHHDNRLRDILKKYNVDTSIRGTR